MPKQYFIQLRELPVTGIARDIITTLESIGARFLRTVDHPHAKQFGFAIEVLDAIVGTDVLVQKFREQLMQIIPNVIAVHEIRQVTVPPMPKKPSNVSPKLTAAISQATLDQVTKWLGFPDVWADPTFNGGLGVKIGMPDTGIDEIHNGDYPFRDGPAGGAAAPSRIAAHKDFSTGPPYHPHGTWTAELVGRSARPDGTFKGPLYRATFYYTQVLDPTGVGSSLQVADGINWCIGQKVHVISMSLGGAKDDPIINPCVEAAVKAGIVVVAASGNSGQPSPWCDNTIGSPADADSALAVGATSMSIQNPDGMTYVVSFTSRGPRWNGTKVPNYVVAPGVYLTPGFNDPNNSGTSFATPLTAAVIGAMIAWCLNHQASWTVQKLWSTLENSCELLGYEKDPAHSPTDAYCVQGFGEVKADKAYKAIQGEQPNPPENQATHTYQAPGSYQATVNVVDAQGKTGKATITITVSSQPNPPELEVSLNADQTEGIAPLTVNFTAAVSGGTSPYSYSWDFGD
jgi:hypothetical protein